MVNVRDVMTKHVPKVNASETVLEASKVMLKNKATGVVVFEGTKPVGMLTERSLLRRFIGLNKRPDEVRVREVIAPLLAIDANESTKVAARRMLTSGRTRLGVFDDDKFLGWVTLTDLARENSKKTLVDVVRGWNNPEPKEILCPSCHSGYLRVVTNRAGKVTAWQCTKCSFQQ